MCQENILDSLYHGNISPYTKCFERNSRYAKFVEIISENEHKLTDYLRGIPNSEEEQHLFSQLMNAHGEVSDFSERERFVEGFRLGARFMLDTFLLPRNSAIRDI